jgi:hypothetical protein
MDFGGRRIVEGYPINRDLEAKLVTPWRNKEFVRDRST